MLNTTFFATAFWLTYLCVDPIAKAVYVLRCFYGESLRSGEDLKAELRNFQATGGLTKKVATSLVILSALVLQARAASNDPRQPLAANTQPRRTSVAAAELEHVIRDRAARDAGAAHVVAARPEEVAGDQRSFRGPSDT
jgi:hypothetical protein